MLINVFYNIIILVILADYYILSAKQNVQKVQPVHLAFCLTGQLARLEILSKIHNIFVPNAQLGHQVDIFILLDNQVEEIKQTFWKFDYSSTPYVNFDSNTLSKLIDKNLKPYGNLNINYYIRLEPPSQIEYEVVGNKIPVNDKFVGVQDGSALENGGRPQGGTEPASVRFQNNMRWLGGLRDCVKWMQDVEFEQRQFYDLVIRLRDDTFAFSKWLITYESMHSALTSARTGNYRGVNDHNFVIDRKWADVLLRGFTEDYYFNKTLKNEPWGNPEHRIIQLAEAYNIPVQNTSVCQQPLIPLRGKYNQSHWLLHHSYTRLFGIECKDLNTKYVYNCKCDHNWLVLFKNGAVAMDLHDLY